MNKSHCCEQLAERLSECTIYSIFKDNELWYFYLESRAIEQDVKNGEAEEIGEVMTSSEFVIYYCQFCGMKLL